MHNLVIVIFTNASKDGLGLIYVYGLSPSYYLIAFDLL